jgi:hypothetical protein
MRRLVLSLTLLTVAALLVPPAASALIQIDRGIAGARLGNTKAQVRVALGNPNRIVNGTNVFGNFTEFRYAGRIRVTFQSGNRVTAVTTRGRGDRTVRNVGVGSTLNAVMTRVPQLANCIPIPGGRLCQTGAGLPGERITVFFLRNGRVTRVVVGFVID